MSSQKDLSAYILSDKYPDEKTLSTKGLQAFSSKSYDFAKLIAVDISPDADFSPEQHMWLTSLLDGILSACKGETEDDMEEMEWLLSDEMFCGSYAHSCAACNINHIEFRDRILNAREKIGKLRNVCKKILRGENYDIKGTKGDVRAGRAERKARERKERALRKRKAREEKKRISARRSASES